MLAATVSSPIPINGDKQIEITVVIKISPRTGPPECSCVYEIRVGDFREAAVALVSEEKTRTIEVQDEQIKVETRPAR